MSSAGKNDGSSGGPYSAPSQDMASSSLLSYLRGPSTGRGFALVKESSTLFTSAASSQVGFGLEAATPATPLAERDDAPGRARRPERGSGRSGRHAGPAPARVSGGSPRGGPRDASRPAEVPAHRAGRALRRRFHPRTPTTRVRTAASPRPVLEARPVACARADGVGVATDRGDGIIARQEQNRRCCSAGLLRG